MSSQTGVFYFDLRPVPLRVEQELFNALGAADTDARGKHVAPGLVLAHAATWIDNIAENERQPHASILGNIITFDGRLDNRPDLLVRLRDSLHGEQTDSALALSAYEGWGVEGLVNLVGDWSIAVWELATRSLILASDYVGERPLYYHANHQRVIWSSYLKPLVSMTRATDLDDHFVAGFLVGTGSPNRTPYRGILSVPPVTRCDSAHKRSMPALSGGCRCTTRSDLKTNDSTTNNCALYFANQCAPGCALTARLFRNSAAAWILHRSFAWQAASSRTVRRSRLGL